MNSTIFEINTRVWIKRFTHENNVPKLLNVPDNYWKSLVYKGIKYIWFMGVWETVPEAVDEYCFVDGLPHEYSLALPDWKEDDVIGSPYSINNYTINKMLGTTDEFIQFKEKLNELGLKVILDFIPNHFSAQNTFLNSNPEIFLEGDEIKFLEDNRTYFQAKNGKIYAHGKDPYFNAWKDTVQINYSSKAASNFMINSLVNVSKLCDGVRCDMAMLSLNRVFNRTWNIHSPLNHENEIENEFWHHAINTVKSLKPNFLFIAEAYWDLEWQLQQIGFDYTYDKKLLDRLEFSNAENINGHLHAEESYQQKSMRFIENHDENRAITAFGIEKSKAAAVVASTIQGLIFFNDGQFEGKSIKLPVQLGREPIEEPITEIVEFYDKLLKIRNNPIFFIGKWNLLCTIQLHRDFTNKNILAWQWKLNNDSRIVIVNFSAEPVYCRIKFDLDNFSETVILRDLLNDKEYERNVAEIINEGLFVHLDAYKSHIFEIA